MRYCWPLNSNKSELSLSHARFGGSGCSIGSFSAFLCYFWQGSHCLTWLMISFVIPGHKTDVRVRKRHFSCPRWPWCMMFKTSGLRVGGITVRSPFSTKPSSIVSSSIINSNNHGEMGGILLFSVAIPQRPLLLTTTM